MKILKKFWKYLEDIHLFERFVRVRYGLVLWGGLGLLAIYIIFGYLLSAGVIYVQTISQDKKIREKTIKIEHEKSMKYATIEEENRNLKRWNDDQAFRLYKSDLIFRLYDYYKNAGNLGLAKYYWINKKLFLDVYDTSVEMMDLCPSFRTHYFQAFPAEESALKTIVIRRYPKLSGPELELMITKEEGKYLDLAYVLVEFSKCKLESNFNTKAISTNWKKNKDGTYVLDKEGKKIFLSNDWGIEQINDICMMPRDPKVLGAPDNLLVAVAKRKPYLKGKDKLDLKMNMAMRSYHTELLIKNKERWLLIDWEFYVMVRQIMWYHYYPEMIKIIG